MSRRKKQALLIGLLILAIILAILLFWRRAPQAPAPATVVVNQQETTITPTPTPSSREQQEVRNGTASLQALAKTFAERYGSFSSESDFANIRDVLPLMTDAYRAESERFIATAETPEELYTVTTRVITVTVDEASEANGYAKLTLNTQREESHGDVQNISVRYQPLVLEFVFSSGAWKVSSATWQ